MTIEDVPQGDTNADTGSADVSAEAANNVETPTEGSDAAVETSGTDAPAAEAAAETEGGEKPAEETAEAAEVDYSTLEYPEAVFTSDDDKVAFGELAKELGLSGENASKALKVAEQIAQNNQQKAIKAANDMKAEWYEQSKADKEFGGEDFAKNLDRAQRTYNKFATEGLNELLNVSGLANHPDMMRFMLKVADMVEDDSLLGGNPQSTGQPSKEPLQKRMFPSMHNKS